MSNTPEYLKLWWKGPRGRYHKHKFNAKHRGIAFLLTFEEWWDIWQASGKWEQRGQRGDQYAMARFGDEGAYEAGNVRICLVSENVAERNRNCRVLPEVMSAVKKAHWAAATPEERKRWAMAAAKSRTGHTVSAAARENHRKGALESWARRRGEID